MQGAEEGCGPYYGHYCPVENICVEGLRRSSLYAFCLLLEAKFVGSAHMPESVDNKMGDDDKIYFFFTERALEYDCYSEQVVSRVARVCKVGELLLHVSISFC